MSVDNFTFRKGDFPSQVNNLKFIVVWIGDPVIDPSQWLVVTRQGVFPLDLIGLLDRWSCYRSESVARRNSPRVSPWLDKIVVSLSGVANPNPLILLSVRVSGSS